MLEVAVGDYDVDLSRLTNCAEKKYCEERAQHALIGRAESKGQQLLSPIGESKVYVFVVVIGMATTSPTSVQMHIRAYTTFTPSDERSFFV